MSMKSFKVREGKIKVDGVMYSEKESDTLVKGKWGRIQSISISGKQYFPYGGSFDDGTLVVTEDSTGIVEETKPKSKRVSKTKKK